MSDVLEPAMTNVMDHLQDFTTMEYDGHSICVGSTFNTFQEFENALTERTNYFGERWVKARNLRSVEKANNAIVSTKLHFKAEFVYAFVTFTCQRSGTYLSKAKHQKHCKTLKSNCPAFIKLRANRTRGKLVVIGCLLEHNHDLSSNTWQPPIKAECDWSNDVEIECDVACENDNMLDKAELSVTNTTTAAGRSHQLNVNEDSSNTNSCGVDENGKTPENITPNFVSNSTTNIINSTRTVPLSFEPRRKRRKVQQDNVSKRQMALMNSYSHSHSSDASESGIKNDDDVTGSVRNNYSVKLEDTLKELLVKLLESKHEDQCKDFSSKSKHRTYGLTVVEKLDLLDLKVAFKARKEIDDVLLKYILGYSDNNGQVKE